MKINSIERVGFFWHNKDGLVDCDEFKTIDMGKLSEINKGPIPMPCNKAVEDENGGLRNSQPVVQFLRRSEYEDYLKYPKCPNAIVKNIVAQASTVYLTLICHNKEQMDKRFKIQEEAGIISIDVIEDGAIVENNSFKEEDSNKPGFYADSVLLLLPESLKQKSKPNSFGEYCLYVVVRHQFVHEEDGKTTVVNLFISKEVDAVMAQGDKNLLCDLKVLPFSKFWNLDTLNITLLRYLVMDFLVDGFAYIIGLRPMDPNFGKKKLKRGKIYAKQIDKVMVFERIRSVCTSVPLKNFIKKLPQLMIELAQQFSSDRPLTLVRCKESKKNILRFEEDRGSELAGIITVPADSFTYEGGFDPHPHHLVIIGTAEEPITVSPPFWKCEFQSVETFCSKVLAPFEYKPEIIIIYGALDEIEKVKEAIYERNISKITSIYNGITKKIIHFN